ncbi:hypothetical protein DRN85_07545 [Methanosarcinales archaeon]|nr:MAG: hypothetical protein DRN85_07545 [Methanosarcinales archaeon]
MSCEAIEIGISIVGILIPFLLYILKKLFELSNHTSHILTRLESLDNRVEKLEKKTEGIASIEQLLQDQAIIAGRVERMEGWMMRNGYNPD